MARIRTIKPEMSGHPTLAKVSRDARLLMVWLITDADDVGRVVASPKRLAGQLYPLDEDVDAAMVSGWLDELEAVGLIERYESGGGKYLEVVGWSDHQLISKPTPSRLPGNPGKPRDVQTPKPDAREFPRETQGNPGKPENCPEFPTESLADLGPRTVDHGSGPVVSDVGKPTPPKRRDDLILAEAMEVFGSVPSCGAWATEVVKRAKSLEVPVRSLARLVVRFQALDGATDLACWTAPGRNPEVVWAAASILQAHPNLTATEISERWARWRESGNHKFKGWRGFASAWPTLGANPSSDPDHPDETYDEAMERLYAAAVRSHAAIETQGAIA